MKNMVALCKRRGFVFQTSDIYGGMNGFWDYGPFGVALKNNIRDIWWHDMVKCSPLGEDNIPLRILGLDSSIIQHPTTWKASGHTDNFSDPMVDCKKTKSRYRADQIVVYVPKDKKSNYIGFAFMDGEDGDVISKKIRKLSNSSIEHFEKTILTDIEVSDYKFIMAPDTDEVGTFTEPRAFNLMFETRVGAVVSDSSLAYLRPETAQGIFANYKNILDSCGGKIPFGIAQVGKAFRNEVTPRNFIFRSREFEQMELEWFCSADEAVKWHEFWIDRRYSWWKLIGLNDNKMRIRRHAADELSHYAKNGNGTVDIEYQFPFSGESGFSELEGIAHRCDFDLQQHQNHSGVKQGYRDQITGETFIPHVIEPSAGLTRAMLAVLCNAYCVDESRPSGMYMNFHPSIAPLKAAIMPLQGKGEQWELSSKIFMKLREHYDVAHDDKQSIGKRYAKNDEIGTPFCVTVDDESLSDGCVTVRHRNTTKQDRVSLDCLEVYIAESMRRM